MMMYRLAARVVCFAAICLPVVGYVRAVNAQGADALPGTTSEVRSDFFTNFDAEKLGRMSRSYFERNVEFNVVSNLKLTPPGDWFKIFRIKGNISDEKLRDLLGSLRKQCEEGAKAGDITITAGRDVVDRPISVLKTLLATQEVHVGSIQGFYVTYAEGGITGAVDVVAAQVPAKDPSVNKFPHWSPRPCLAQRE